MELSELVPGMKVLFHDEEIKYLGENGFFVYCVDEDGIGIMTTPDKLRRIDAKQ